MEDEEIIKMTLQKEKELLISNLQKEKEKNKEYKQEIDKLNLVNQNLQEQLDRIIYSRTYKFSKKLSSILKKKDK